MSTNQSDPHIGQKYQVAAPRYTSYPTMPYWEPAYFDLKKWQHSLKLAFAESNQAGGISLYVHLPFCEDLCTYCGCNTRITKNHQVEAPYIAAVLKEWQMYRAILGARPVIREIHLGGGTPTFFSPAYLQLLIRGLLEDATIPAGAQFSFEAHPANTTAEHLRVLYNLGFRRLSLGIQDFDPAVQHIINRRQSFEQVKLVTEQARSLGYTSINYDLIYGLPLQTLAGLTQTLRQVAELAPHRIAFYSYAHVPWLKPGQRKFTEHDLPGTAAKLKLYETGRSLLKSYGYLEVGMDHFALPEDELLTALNQGKLHRNFMGYTAHQCPLLIGMGVSAISDACYAYAQNVKVVEDYLQMIAQGRLPLLKGHIMTGEDLMIRKHILNIMCKGATSWNQTEEPGNVIFLSQRLQPLADDGLIDLDAEGLKVLPAGERYLRNICMALDARLCKAQPPGGPLFSMAV